MFIRSVLLTSTILFSLTACNNQESDANTAFVEAAGTVTKAMGTKNMKERYDLLQAAIKEIDEITTNYKGSSVAVKIVSGEKIGGMSYSELKAAFDATAESPDMCFIEPTKRCISNTIWGKYLEITSIEQGEHLARAFQVPAAADRDQTYDYAREVLSSQDYQNITIGAIYAAAYTDHPSKDIAARMDEILVRISEKITGVSADDIMAFLYSKALPNLTEISTSKPILDSLFDIGKEKLAEIISNGSKNNDRESLYNILKNYEYKRFVSIHKGNYKELLPKLEKTKGEKITLLQAVADTGANADDLSDEEIKEIFRTTNDSDLYTVVRTLVRGPVSMSMFERVLALAQTDKQRYEVERYAFDLSEIQKDQKHYLEMVQNSPFRGWERYLSNVRDYAKANLSDQEFKKIGDSISEAAASRMANDKYHESMMSDIAVDRWYGTVDQNIDKYVSRVKDKQYSYEIRIACSSLTYDGDQRSDDAFAKIVDACWSSVSTDKTKYNDILSQLTVKFGDLSEAKRKSIASHITTQNALDVFGEEVPDEFYPRLKRYVAPDVAGIVEAKYVSDSKYPESWLEAEARYGDIADVDELTAKISKYAGKTNIGTFIRSASFNNKSGYFEAFIDSAVKSAPDMMRDTSWYYMDKIQAERQIFTEAQARALCQASETTQSCPLILGAYYEPIVRSAMDSKNVSTLVKVAQQPALPLPYWFALVAKAETLLP